jgi:hypothetical protein
MAFDIGARVHLHDLVPIPILPHFDPLVADLYGIARGEGSQSFQPFLAHLSLSNKQLDLRY